MAQPNSKATLKEYCLRRLGKPVLEINVSDDQIDDALDYSIEKFQEFHYEGAERVYLKHQFTATDVTNFTADTTELGSDGTTEFKTQNNFLVMPDYIRSVNGIFTFQDKGTPNMFDIRYQIRLNDLYDFTSTQFYHYYMIQSHLSSIDWILEGLKPIRFSTVQNRLYIDFDWTEDSLEDQYIVIKCWRALDPTTWTEIYNQMWVKDYAAAKIKKQWGSNMTKFQNVQMPGGVTLNGEMIYNDAVEELKILDEQLRQVWETPPLDMIG